MTIRERLACVETSLEQVVFELRQMHAEIREQIEAQRKYMEHQELRVRNLELGAEQTRTHLRWMKAAWAAVQGTVIGWVGMK